MERVLGIGGIFFRARGPEALARWYRDPLDVDLTPSDYDGTPLLQQAGPTVFQPFPADSAFFGPLENRWMLNFRVRDLAATVDQLERACVAVDVDPVEYPNGVFARLGDPEGNPVQLWEPREGVRPP